MNISLKDISNYAATASKPLNRYKVVLFVAFIALLYGYVLVQINQASNTQPATDQAVAAGRTSPHIDDATIQKLQQLQDNSVNVKVLFNEARTNPFE